MFAQQEAAIARRYILLYKLYLKKSTRIKNHFLHLDITLYPTSWYGVNEMLWNMNAMPMSTIKEEIYQIF